MQRAGSRRRSLGPAVLALGAGELIKRGLVQVDGAGVRTWERVNGGRSIVLGKGLIIGGK